MKDLTKALGMKRILSTAYHFQTDDQMEWINYKVEILLWYYVNYQQDNWTKWSLAAEFQYNNKKHAATDYIPFKLNFG